MATPSVDPCDYCTMTNVPHLCPGAAVHCRRGNHCTYQEASCAAESGADIHPRKCCSCKEELRG